MPQGYFSDRYFAGYFPNDYLPDALTGVTYRDLAGAASGMAGGVGALDLYRSVTGATFVAGTDAWATADLVELTTRVGPVSVGESVTVYAPLAAAIGAAQGEAFRPAARGGVSCAVLAPLQSARGGAHVTLTTLRGAGGGASGPGARLQPARAGVSANTTVPQPACGGLGGQ